MKVCLRHYKGADKKPKPTIFLFRENTLLIFCPITYILARIIRDKSVLVDGYTSAEAFFNTNLKRLGKKAMRLKRPLFRQSVLEASCGRDAGLENVLTSYYFRRAAINAANSLASDAVRDQIARYNPAGGVFNGLYLNEIMNFNSQDTYLESNVSEDSLTRAFGHISLRCHPGAPSEVPSELLSQLLAADPEITSLGQEFKCLHDQIKVTYRFIKHAPEKKRQEHKDL
ncbi:hypothetical protein LARI1_G005246 [Lachnellula arida]|uniref:Uncharacterized protein n=1 Tax=Lachnellula arida TaxID=1316785 RepID=A0A8T9BGT9_9HELO|nr:hypothetical protein LARI1_G005246 [Lachnellula arida]